MLEVVGEARAVETEPERERLVGALAPAASSAPTVVEAETDEMGESGCAAPDDGGSVETDSGWPELEYPASGSGPLHRLSSSMSDGSLDATEPMR